MKGRRRERIYKPGDRFSVQIPKNADPKLLKLYNDLRSLSPVINQVMTEHAHRVYPETPSII